MTFNPDTGVEDMVILVTDTGHQRYGQLGEMCSHDWNQNGQIDVRFRDGITEQFYDGMMAGNPPSQVRGYYRHFDKKGLGFDRQGTGPATFQNDFLKLGAGTLEELAENYKSLFNEDLPPISFLKTLPLELFISFKNHLTRD